MRVFLELHSEFLANNDKSVEYQQWLTCVLICCLVQNPTANAECFHMKVICQRLQLNKHTHLCNFLFNSGWPFLFVWLICGEIQEKCQRFRTTLCFVDLVKNAARPGGQDLNLCLFLVKSDFLVGGSGVPWHFLCRGILFIWPKDSAESHQPTATKHIGLHCKRPSETRLLAFSDAKCDTFSW